MGLHFSNWIPVCILTALTFITRVVFMYQGGMPEPDSVVMAAGMTQWFTSNINFGDAFLYGRQLNPGIYFLFRIVYPAIFNDASHVISFLNWIGLISSTVMIAPLYLLLRKHFDRRVTTGCILLIIFSPLVWELGTYFHPIIPATLLLLLSLLTWEKIAWSPSGCVFCLLTYLLASASVVMRTEVLLVTPALCAGILLSRTRRRDFVQFLSMLAAVLITYMGIVQSISKPTDTPSHGIRQFVQMFGEGLWHSFSFAATRRSIVWACLGIGTGLVIVSAFGLIARLRSHPLKSGVESYKGFKDSIVAIIWIAPVLILWLPYPVPIIRHFFLIVPAAGWIAGESVLRQSSLKATITIVFFAIICNLAVPEILYRSYNITHPESKKSPNGAFFYYHQKANERILRNHAMQESVLSVFNKLGRSGGEVMSPGIFVAVTWESYGYLYYAMAQTGEVSRLPEIESYPGMHTRRYTMRGTEIRMAFIMGYITESNLVPLLKNIRSAEQGGFSVFIPEEIAQSAIAAELGEGSYITY